MSSEFFCFLGFTKLTKHHLVFGNSQPLVSGLLRCFWRDNRLDSRPRLREDDDGNDAVGSGCCRHDMLSRGGCYRHDALSRGGCWRHDTLSITIWSAGIRQRQETGNPLIIMRHFVIFINQTNKFNAILSYIKTKSTLFLFWLKI